MISTTKTGRPPEPPSDAGPEPEEAEDPLPFSVELGEARAYEQGFAVPGSRSEQGTTRAFAALWIDGGGKLVDLGAVHGDPEPPLLVAHGSKLLALVIDGDAAGLRLRLGEIVDARGSARFAQAAELAGIPRDASGFVAAQSEGRGLFAYTAARDKTAIFAGSFDAAALSAPLSSRPLQLSTDDASEPRIVARKGGFWLAYVSEPRPKNAPKLPRTERDAGDEAPEKLVELGPRELRVVSLDGSGNPQGEPRRIAPPSDRPFMFDLAADSDAGALVLWQESHGAPGGDGAEIKLARVRPDGSLESRAIDDERLGAGVPALLVDPRPKTGDGAHWLSAAGADDLTLFGAIGSGKGSLQTDPLVRSSTLLAVNGGTFLAAQSRGQDVELRLIACSPALSPPAP